MTDSQDTSEEEKHEVDVQSPTFAMMITHSQSNDAGSSPSAHGHATSFTSMQQQSKDKDETAAEGNSYSR